MATCIQTKKGGLIPLKIQLQQIKERMAKRYHSKCYFCGCKWHKKGMVFHHRKYIPNDVIYKNYPSSLQGRIQYHLDLEVEIKKDPKRFRYLCNQDHQAFEKLMRFSDKKLNKLLRERKKTLKLRVNR